MTNKQATKLETFIRKNPTQINLGLTLNNGERINSVSITKEGFIVDRYNSENRVELTIRFLVKQVQKATAYNREGLNWKTY